jgi:hypothetical protein
MGCDDTFLAFEIEVMTVQALDTQALVPFQLGRTVTIGVFCAISLKD